MNNINTKKTTMALMMIAAGMSFHANAFDTDQVQDKMHKLLMLSNLNAWTLTAMTCSP